MSTADMLRTVADLLDQVGVERVHVNVRSLSYVGVEVVEGPPWQDVRTRAAIVDRIIDGLDGGVREGRPERVPGTDRWRHTGVGWLAGLTVDVYTEIPTSPDLSYLKAGVS